MRARGQVDEDARAEERRVERVEAAPRKVRAAREVFAQQSFVIGERGGNVRDDDAFGQAGERREFGPEVAVDEDGGRLRRLRASPIRSTSG